MIIFIENGRLGNQLFQLNYIFKIKKKNELVILIGFDLLKKILKKHKKIKFFSSKNFFCKLIIEYRYYITLYLKLFRIIKIVYENSKDNVKIQKGFLSNISLVSGFFQNPNFIKSKFISLINRKTLYEKLANKKLDLLRKKNTKVYFIHYRSKDFKSWPHKNYPAILPQKWFYKCLKLFPYKFNSLILLSDNPSEFKINLNKKIVKKKNSILIDFFIMINSDGGIISPSTFSWWASYINKLDNKDNLILAPKYWAGHIRKKTIPKNIETLKFKYINVLKREYKNLV